MKEQFEWIHSWSDYADRNDLPRVLLVGDSITHSYHEMVRELLRGKYYVDYIATSYAIDSPFFSKLIRGYAEDNTYSIIHFNHGLHGKHIEKEDYLAGIEKLLNEMKRVDVKIILALSTSVNQKDVDKIDESWEVRVQERNAAILYLAEKYGYEVDDLYTISREMPYELRNGDGFHYLPDGAKILAQKVVNSIIK